MLKNNFFQFQPVKLSLISDILNKELAIETDLDFDQVIFEDINTIKNSQAKSLTFFSNIKYKENLLSAKPLGVIINKKYLSYVSHIPVKIVTDNPYYIYSQILPLFVKSKTNKHNFSSNNNISPSAKIGENCQIGSNIVIEDEVAIGNNVTIGHGVVIKRGVRIGDNVHIEGNNILQYCVVGKGSSIGSGTNIGQRGFGFAFHQGHHYEVAQVGIVEIGNNVNIGSNVAIDRGAVDNTVIGDNAIIDNLVQIAHNVTIGKGAVIVAQSGIAGSTIIGDYTMLGGQAGIAGHLKIGKQVQIAAQSGVIKDVGDKEIVGGYPAVGIKDWHKQSIILKQLSKVFKKFNKWVK